MMQKVDCVFCNNQANKQFLYEFKVDMQKINANAYECISCGNYTLSPHFSLGNLDDKKHLIAGYLAETKHLRKFEGNTQQQNFITGYFNMERLKNIFHDPIFPKTIIHKLEKLLVFLHKNTDKFGSTHDIDKISFSVAYAEDSFELSNMFRELATLDYGGYVTKKYFSIQTKQYEVHIDERHFILNTKGHSRAEELISTNIHSTKVFVAMGFEKDLLYAMENAIEPACRECGFDAFLIKDKEHNNGITDEIIVGIKTSKFVVVDFTYNNCGAYFEAGYAQGYGLEVVRCCKREWFDEVDENGNKKNKLHFDVSHYNFILWNDEENLKEQLKNRIRATIPGAKMEDAN